MERANQLNQRFRTLYFQNNLPEALKILKEYREVLENILGPEHPKVGRALIDLAVVHNKNGESALAAPLAQQAKEIYEKAQLTEDIVYAKILSNLGWIYFSMGDYPKAGMMYEQASSLFERFRGRNDEDIVQHFNTVSVLYVAKGEYTTAERILRDVVEMRKKRGENTIPVALALGNLAALYDEKGDSQSAVPLFEQAIKTFDHFGIKDDPNLALILNNLGALYLTRGAYDVARPLVERALEILEKKLGKEHPNVAYALENLGSAFYLSGEYAKAEPLFQRAKAIYEKTLPPDHPALAIAQEQLAALLVVKHRYDDAERIYDQVAKTQQRALGPDHPALAHTLWNMAQVQLAKGNSRKSIEAQRICNDIRERNLRLLFALGSERQKRAYMRQLLDETDFTISLHLQYNLNSREATRLALTTLLRRKGRILDVMSGDFRILHQNLSSEGDSTLITLRNAYTALANLYFRKPENDKSQSYQSEMTALRERVQRLESKMSEFSVDFRQHLHPIDLGEIQSAIPEGTVLIEYYIYRPFNIDFGKETDAWGPERYVAYAVPNRGEPSAVDLGNAALINRSLEGLRGALRVRGGSVQNVKQIAQRVEALTFRRVRKLFGSARRFIVCPDGDLNLIPFAALVDEGGKYLLENFAIMYDTTGRNILRVHNVKKSSGLPLIVASPDFNSAGSSTAKGGGADIAASRSRDISASYYPPLWGAEQEATTLGEIMPSARVLKGIEATEQAIKSVRAPSVLHIATHGFFLPDQKSPRTSFHATKTGMEFNPSPSVDVENPLLRTGLVLAGANQLRNESEDGLLTALEASSLDLSGTKLVVLSACDTGLGAVHNGEGVYGLRRAFALGGAESLVMSLWKVDDRITRDMMVAYYMLLRRGLGKDEALRRVQVNMIRGKNPGGGLAGIALKSDVRRRQSLVHPFYWASFIQSGDCSTLPNYVFEKPQSPQSTK